jgi:SAM-dependent methyltransferase
MWWLVDLGGKNKLTLTQWCQSESGKAVMALEREMLAPIIDHYRPMRCLQLSGCDLVSGQGKKIRESVRVHFAASDIVSMPEAGVSVVASPDKLPFPSEYFDLVVCSHGHELAEHAGSVVQEISRVLMPEGLVVFTGLNPHGLWRQQDFPGVQDWWRCRLSQADLQALAKLVSLVEVYTEYKGFWQCAEPASRWQIAATQTLAHYLPQTSVVVKTVFRKRVLAKSGLVYHAEAALSMMG